MAHEHQHHLSHEYGRIFALVGVVVITILLALTAAYRTIGRLNAEYVPSVHAVNEIKYEVAIAHLWFEEIISGDRNESIDTVWEHLDMVDSYAAALLEGGTGGFAEIVALRDDELRREISEVRTRLVHFRSIAEERYRATTGAGVGTPLDQEFDAVFGRLLEQTIRVEVDLNTSLTGDLRRLRRRPLMMAGLTLLLGVLVAMVLVRSRRRIRTVTGDLAASRDLFRAVVVNADPAVFATDLQGNLTVCEGGVLRRLGHQEGGAVGWSLDKLFPDQSALAEGVRKALQGEIHRGEIVTADLVAEVVVSPILDAAGEVNGAVGMAVDVTDYRRAQVQVRRLGEAMQQTGDAVYITELDGTIVDLNRAFERSSGYMRDELIGATPRILKSGEHGDAFYREMWGTIAAGRIWRGRVVNKAKDGHLVTEVLTISPMTDDEGRVTHFVAVSRDISSQLEMEKKLQQAQKLEAVGLLAGGVAHDFNNILQAIIGHAELASDNITDAAGLADDLEQIRLAADRATTLTRQLLAYSRRQVLEPHDLDFNELIAGVLKMIDRLIGDDVDLEFTPGNRLATVHADPGQVEQVIMNLCVNARDAMPNGGRICIETENVLIDSDYVRANRWAQEGRYVLLSIGDDGVGMAPEEQERVFEPFFSTKSEGSGTGLGLATVYGIVKQHGGMINLYSETGRGTLITVYMPSVQRAAAEVGAPLKGPVQGGNEGLLIAEDDPDLRHLIARILEGAGYHVVSAASGSEAVALFKEHRADLRCAVLDVVMPEMGGREVCDAIGELEPALPVLFISGYNVNAIHTNFVLEQGLSLLRKPFGHDELLRRVRELLDGA